MAYPYSITTRADGETITHTKYNADHQNHADNQIPEDTDDYSANTTEMRTQTSPGTVGAESLATTLAGELERLRYILAKRAGALYWYSTVGSVSHLRGLRGTNGATPATQYTFSASVLVLGNLTDGPMIDVSGTALTVDITQAGPVANGRDQAGAFSVDSWVHLYAIHGLGQSLACLASTVAPTTSTGPTLPSGYTHWAYIATLRLDGSTEFLRTRIAGASVMYDVDSGPNETRVLTDGVDTSFTDVDMSALVPPQALSVHLNAFLYLTHNATALFDLSLRPNGGTHMTAGHAVAVASSAVNGVQTSGMNWLTYPIESDGILEYKISAAPATAGGAQLEVTGYRVPNGAE